ncbi:DNA-binding response regulator, NarL/FixJ family, contains REC and HTH domains [Pedobacter steynii]|uniref:DNA-binding response regulator, NarL/FixJ family, contains REC and HTH domains n=1 Tax=Pedobacter steynii TaxID=430522 RepID=A0A1G9SDJ3_9SPHI|nr:response regulator transcription factor [Pedobacter steynii]NQX37454.1 response regulator transcription factor [Pedobacter steynii]SDM33544.1 DNA-binding response regulator, NarL/FixJ family, contains REC and HTH domains [Pedobacter steynii]
MLQVLLAEDHNIVRNGIRMLLETDQDINIAAEAVNGIEVLEYVASGQQVDVVLADINMPGMDGMMLLKEMKLLKPETYVMMLSMHDNEKYVAQAFTEGASGYLLKSVSADELIFSLKHVGTGGKYLCSELSIRMLDKLMLNGYHSVSDTKVSIEFSLREIEVLHLIAEGLTNNEMSEQLFISKRTVEGHRQSLIEKTGARNTAALIRYAVLNGVIQ